jgi:hypothetical protein
MLNTLNNIVNYYHQIPPGFWQALIASGILSPLVHAWHQVHVTRKEKEIADWAMIIIVILVAFAASVFQYLLTTHPSNPTVIAMHTAVVGFMMTPLYIIVVKPLWTWLSKKSAAADIYNSQLKSSLIPSTGLPIAGTSVSATADAGQKDGF